MRRSSLLVLPVLLALAACEAAPPEEKRPSASKSPDLAAFRSEWLEACIGGGRDAAPPGTPVDRHCACAIDRLMAGKTLEQLEAEQASGAYRAPFQAEMRRCIREIPS